jgi:hypothetical protein
MLINLLLLDTNLQQREFSCWRDNLSSTVDAIGLLMGEGYEVVSAQLVSQSHRIDLPIEPLKAGWNPTGLQTKAEWEKIVNTIPV